MLLLVVLIELQVLLISSFFFFNDTATTEIYTLSLHDALPICPLVADPFVEADLPFRGLSSEIRRLRSEEHTSELQSQSNLVCRLLLEKKKIPSHSQLYHPSTALIDLTFSLRSESRLLPLVRSL